MDNGHEYFLYLHPTFGTHYAARLLNLGRAWVAEGARWAGLDIDAIQRSGLTAEILEGLTARTSELDL
ncbi:13458_t:CDS:2 [Gigaspora rosea]|nr:13458_t:CDS:2 [Gigaspora rosea]